MWKFTLLVSILIFMAGCGSNSINNEPKPTPAPIVNAPEEPTNLVEQVVDTHSIMLKWKDVATNEQGYEVYCSNINLMPAAPYATLAADASNCIVTNLTQDVAYYFWVLAYNSGGKSTAATGTETPRNVPAAPSQLVLNAGPINTISLVWVDNATNEAGYNVYFSLSNTKPAMPYGLPLPADSTNVTVNGLLQYTAYYFWVEAFNNAGPSVDLSGMAAIGNKPLSPDNFTASATGRTVNLVWNDNSDNETGFNLYWSNVNVKPAAPDTVLLSNSTADTISGLTPGTTYYFWLEAVNIIGSSVEATASASIEALPDTPASFNGLVLDDTSLQISWSDSSNETGYNVYYSTATSQPASPALTLPAGSNSIVLTGLQAFTTYYFWIEATNASGSSGLLTGQKAPGTAPASPSGFAAYNTNAYRIDLSWNSVSNAQGYYVYYSTNGVKPSAPNAILASAASSWSLTNIFANKNYSFWLDSTNIVAVSLDTTATVQTWIWNTRNPQIRQAYIDNARVLHFSWWLNESNATRLFATNVGSNFVCWSNAPYKPAVSVAPTSYDKTNIDAYYIPTLADFEQPVYVWADAVSSSGVLTWDYVISRGPDMSGSIAAPTINDYSVTITWPDTTGEAGYRIYYAPSNVRPMTQTTNTLSNVTTCVITNLDPGATYYFWVDAAAPGNGGMGASGANISGSFTTTGTPITLISTNTVDTASDTTGWTGTLKNPTNAFDNNDSTSWGADNGSFSTNASGLITNGNFPIWVQTDLGVSQSLAEVKINWGGAYPKQYKIQASDDASIWTDIVSVTGNTGNGNKIFNVAGSTGRYVRFYVDNNYGTNFGTLAYGIKILDMRVYK